ncbi:hypothetical protein BN970_00273 [Mycolicibacterium conceptionense]|uniref:Uncharacterized protein n=1 Tax=Mycolicibacterium conceptionense TaxID=451644 RepID=A0A0U1CXL6_9MYCO|nr:hypothetical protein BN970_00273 [Mycolicibacterium conceptionense]
MDLIWWAVAMVGCLALAGCVGLALLPKPSVDRDQFIPLANTRRLTRLPAYVRTARRRTVSAVDVAMRRLWSRRARPACRRGVAPPRSQPPRTSWCASAAH